MRDRQFIKVNPKMEEMFGYSTGELTGRSVHVLYPNEEDYLSAGKQYPVFLRTDRYVQEKPLMRKDGEIIWCLVMGKLVRPDIYTSSIWIVQDINSRKIAESKLRRSKEQLTQIVERRTVNLQRTNRTLKEEVLRRRNTERKMIEGREKYRALFRHIPMGILVTDENGKVLEVNPTIRSMTDTSTLEDFEKVACDPSLIISQDGQTLSLNELIRAKSPPTGHRVERAHIRWRAKDGSLLEYEVISIRLSVKGLGTAFVFEDTTEQSRARQREHEQQQNLAHATRLSLMGQFTSALAHELAQPLNSCLSYLAGLQHRLAANEPYGPELIEATNKIDLHLGQVRNIIRNVRSFVTRHHPDNAEIVLPDLVAQTLELLHFQLHNNHVQVEVKTSRDLPSIKGNPVEIQQLLINLVVNGIDAMQDTPDNERTIKICLSSEGQSQVAVKVSDNGVGIPAECSNKIFESYYTTKPGGLGLGLMMCRTILDSHGGYIKLLPTRHGGTTFKFVLPALLKEGKHGPNPSNRIPD
jgi:PAS domain S-box-containing protein